MVKRNDKQSFSIMNYVYMIIALMVLVASWESSRTEAAIAGAGIPEESIRLRILAHSDSPYDQWLKREVRDAIVEQMNQWVTGPQSIEAARTVISSRLYEMDAVVGEVIAKNGFTYDYHVELGVVPFPTKMYGSVVYPAGEYEALRVTIGAGEGQNWWCVLFPPLCFVDVTTGEAVAKNETRNEAGKSGSAAVNLADAGKAGTVVAEASFKEAKPQVKFFLWDALQRVGITLKGWFA
jgi:stage II sporulation protein R